MKRGLQYIACGYIERAVYIVVIKCYEIRILVAFIPLISQKSESDKAKSNSHNVYYEDMNRNTAIVQVVSQQAPSHPRS